MTSQSPTTFPKDQVDKNVSSPMAITTITTLPTDDQPPPPTPPHHPTYKISLSDIHITKILTLTHPLHKIKSINQLPSGQSFNNRIYFIKLQSIPPPLPPTISTTSSSSTTTTTTTTTSNLTSHSNYKISSNEGDDYDEVRDEEEVVLKVAGQFFGADKIQNEVCNLILLEKYCGDIPVPRVLGWCEDGVVVRRIGRGGITTTSGDGGGGSSSNDGKDEDGDEGVRVSEPMSLELLSDDGDGDGDGDEDKEEHCKQGWILMTRVPGTTLRKDQAIEHGEKVLKEVAGMVAKWRKRVVAPSEGIGNLLVSRYGDDDMIKKENQKSKRSIDSLQMMVRGLLIAGKSPKHVLATSRDYYEYKLLDQLKILETEDIYIPNREVVVTEIRRLVDDVLPRLTLFGDDKKMSSNSVFTQYDLSPRNILVSNSINTSKDIKPGESPTTPIPTVTGLIDFEFAGFFPPEEESTNCRINNKEDWTQSAWDAFVCELKRLGVDMLEEKEWEQACTLIEIVESIAPWYLREGGVKGSELDRQLEMARDRVKKGVERLERSLVE